MKSFLNPFVVIIIFLFAGRIYAQSDAAELSLYLNPSPKLNGMGITGSSLPNEDPAGFYYNPAQLGYISQTNNISYQFYPSNVNWQGFNSSNYRNTSINIGYNFEKLLNGLNLSAGFGYIHSELVNHSFPMQVPGFPIPNYTIDDKFDSYGFGLGFNYFIQLNIGITYKNISSLVLGGEASLPYTKYNSAVDFGLLLTIPVTKIVRTNLQFNLPGEIPALPYFNFSMGYAQLNNGHEIDYFIASGTEPLPRIARLGYSISTGLNIEINNSNIKALSYDFTVDADDYLVETNPDAFVHSYQGFLGDISIGRNLISLKSNEKVIVHIGHNINFFETISFQIGRFDGRGYYNEKSSGIGFQSKGILTLLKGFTQNSIFNFVADHLDIQYYSSKLFAESPYETNFKGISIVWSGMML